MFLLLKISQFPCLECNATACLSCEKVKNFNFSLEDGFCKYQGYTFGNCKEKNMYYYGSLGMCVENCPEGLSLVDEICSCKISCSYCTISYNSII